MLPEFIDFQGKKWIIKAKVKGSHIEDPSKLKENYGCDMVIRNNDRLTIPEKTNHIYVYGEVSSEGAILFENARDVKYFIDKSGGLKEGANKKAIYVLHPNGNTTKYLVKRNLFASSSREVNLYPGSVIFVPREVDDSVGSRLAAQAYVSILGNLGVALASLSAIND